MKLKGISWLCCAALLFAILYACNKTDSPGTGGGHQVEFVRATISGRVTDENKLPVSGAIVTAGATTATTDINGYFTIRNVYVDKNATLVKVEKAGYFNGNKTIMAEVEKNNPVSIQLMPKTVAGTVSGASGGQVTVPASGGTIQLEANSVVDPQSNQPYTGTVTISASFIDPSADNFREIMPGTLRGINNNNEETGLQSFGMMAVELNGDGGQKLQIAKGKKATLHFPIPQELQNQAPATIPLWSLDETTGLWKEEGEATRQGNEYVGTVGHFSFWNCDAPFPIVNFTVTVKDQAGHALADAEVVISTSLTDTTSISGNGITNAEGIVRGTLPASRTLALKIYNKCRNIIHTQNIGPFNSETDLGTITVNVQSSQITISGKAMDCNNAPITNGYVMLQLENIYYSIPVTNGNFNQAIMRCGTGQTTATLKAYDLNNNISGSSYSFPVTGTTLNAGQLAACGTALNTYINYTLEGVNYQVAPPTDSISALLNDASVIIYAYAKPDTSMHIVFMMNGGAGADNIISAFFVNNGRKGPNGEALYHSQTSTSIPATVSEYGAAVGEYISGAFTTNVYDSVRNLSLPVQCNFRTKITEVQ